MRGHAGLVGEGKVVRASRFGRVAQQRLPPLALVLERAHGPCRGAAQQRTQGGARPQRQAARAQVDQRARLGPCRRTGRSARRGAQGQGRAVGAARGGQRRVCGAWRLRRQAMQGA